MENRFTSVPVAYVETESRSAFVWSWDRSRDSWHMGPRGLFEGVTDMFYNRDMVKVTHSVN